MRPSILALLLPLVLPADKPLVRPYIGELDGAIKSATERNVPILVHVVQEGEEANDRYRNGILPNEELVALSERAVVVMVNDGEHDTKTRRIERGDEVVEETVCVYYNTPSCADHFENWNVVYRRYNENGNMRTPQALVLEPDGTLSTRLYAAGEPPSIGSFKSALQKLGSKLGHGLTAAEYEEARRLRGIARAKQQSKQWTEEWKAWSQLLEIQSAGPLGEEARRSAEAAHGKMKGQLDAALARCDEDFCAGYRELVRLEQAWKKIALGKQAAKARKALEKQKDKKAALKACKLALEAEALWDKAQELLRKGSEKPARSILVKLLKKKYDATPIVSIARERYPELWEAEKARRAN